MVMRQVSQLEKICRKSEAFCSERQPCRNGGTCQNGKCQCMSGTHGPFCERIFWCAYECRPRLTVDCVYNQKDETYGCLCKNRSLVFDYKEGLCKRKRNGNHPLQ
ncbi:hypothetical protein AVEN_13847-1 [Araneus ventricosus]|uniref:EGF-like domain-containing protein n=1 Tax=Araneus ventricosus TaxID=182803 RepID=A0A4Y2LHG2_ARAVE|nr:hypothetical protein AVEN_13847-1 [Araneus ventricosus]